jgi:hypothetical protein
VLGNCKCSEEGPRLRMKRLRIAMVKILKSSLGIVRHLVISIADCIFRKISMIDTIKTAVLNSPCYN